MYCINWNLLKVQTLGILGKKFKETKVFLSFQNDAKTIDDVMPFIVLKKDKATQIMVFLDGDFSAFTENASTHPSEFFFAYEYLLQKLQKEFADNKQDLNKTWEYITKNQSFLKDMVRGITSAGILFVSANGKDSVILRNKSFVKEDWGYLSSEPWQTSEKPSEDAGTPIGKRTFPRRHHHWK